jgi:phage shock protein PspC (stress-responsive transcriptional regulator)
MRKVITGSLNGNAYQFEEGAFEAVRAYLARAASRADSPERAEMLADLEQAIADKCNALLGRHRTVISSEDAQRILREMGPVDDGAPDAGQAAAAVPRGKRLYRIPGDGVMGGVCAGLAAYFGIDVVWVRLFYVLLTFTTGVWFLVWLVQLCITPNAITPEEIATAHQLRGVAGR